jgi:hypothetical protein
VARDLLTRPGAWLANAAVGARFLARLPIFVRSPIGATEGRAIIRRRLAERDVDFLALVRHAVYARPTSPYHALLRHAGCEYGDLERLVSRDGLEGALRALLRQGVFLTVGELKGRQPVARGTLQFHVDPSGLRNAATAHHLPGQTSGSGGPSTHLAIDLRFVRDVAADLAASLEARNGAGWHLAYWDVPGGTIRPLLVCAKAGQPPRRWFSLVDPGSRDLHARYRWSARAARWGSRLAGVRLPAPEYVAIHDPMPIIRWMRQVLASGATPCLLTYSSPAVRLAEAARAAALDLSGARLLLYGEPVTAARLAFIRQAGAEAHPLYIAMETWRLGEACLAPEEADDVHVLSDLHALLQAGPDGGPGLPAPALLVTSLRMTAPLVLLNVALGDQAVVVDRACGCAMERLGWTRHLHTIRSYEKLTAGGMTFLDTDVVRVLEEVLPARFGGAPTHYQLVEGPADDGRPRVRLLVDPVIGDVDARAIARTFLEAIGRGAGAEPIMSAVWAAADLLTVERRPPMVTGSAKIRHVHVGDLRGDDRSPDTGDRREN